MAPADPAIREFVSDVRGFTAELRLAMLFTAAALLAIGYLAELRGGALLAVAVGGATFGIGILAMRFRWMGVRRVAVAPDRLTVTTRSQTLDLPWSEITRIERRWLRRSHFIAVHLRGERRPRVFVLEGFTPQQMNAMFEAVELQHSAASNITPSVNQQS